MGGPAPHAGPRFFRGFIAAWTLLGVWGLPGGPPRAAALDWIPPRAVTAILPSATLAPSTSHTLELVVLASGASANLGWVAVPSGQFPCLVAPSSGSLLVAAGGVGTVGLTVTLPDTANGIGIITVKVTHQSSGGLAAQADASIFAATLGRPEVKPVPGAWRAVAGTSGSVSFQIHSLIGSSEEIALTTGRLNPDPNNSNALFSGSPAPSFVILPAGGTIAVNVPTTLASNAYAGNLNAIQLGVTSAAGISTAVGHALVDASGSIPTALYPIGLAPADEPPAGRDGAALLPDRGYWLVPAGLAGVRVMRTLSTDSIGMVDSNDDGAEDRWIGTIRIPAYAAAIDVIPRFVTASSETLDVGLLAAGRAGLMLLDLRVVEDPLFGTWEDFFDVDGNGIDDRILRTIPLSGFATDVDWFRALSGRAVALVADADTGSVPVSHAYNPASVVAGTGQGIVGIDVGAALDTIANPPYAAGTLATPGTTLDIELRGDSFPDLAIADGASGVSVYGLSAGSGIPAIVTFTPRGTVTLSSAWGTPYARDLAWISNTKDSTYVAVAASAAGVEIARVPKAGGGVPSLVFVQQTLGPAIGLGGAWTGTLGAALGTSGVALMRVPGGAFLDRILPAAGPPYTAPVTLARGAPWAATGTPLEVAAHQSASSAASSLRFEETTGPIPDLLVADGLRWLVLRPGQAPITAVEIEPAPPRARRLRLSVSPNPIGGNAAFDVRAEWDGSAAPAGRAMGAGPALGPFRLEIYDPQGRLVRRIETLRAESTTRILWDGRDDAGRRLSSGRYWARVRGPGSTAAVVPILLLR